MHSDILAKSASRLVFLAEGGGHLFDDSLSKRYCIACSLKHSGTLPAASSRALVYLQGRLKACHNTDEYVFTEAFLFELISLEQNLT